jgi:hypothetical protein
VITVQKKDQDLQEKIVKEMIDIEEDIKMIVEKME